MATRNMLMKPAICDARKARKSLNEATNLDGDPSLSGVGQPSSGQRTTPRAGVGQPSAGRGGLVARRHNDGVDVSDGGKMSDADATRFRAAAPRIIFLGGARPDLQSAAKEALRSMAAPRVADREKVRSQNHQVLEWRVLQDCPGAPLWR